MDREKLKEATIDYSTYTDSDDYDVAMYNAFTDGAQWLMGQPLADRLTEEEREKIKKLNAIIESMFDMLPEGHVNCRRVIKVENMLIEIFGKEMFEK